MHSDRYDKVFGEFEDLLDIGETEKNLTEHSGCVTEGVTTTTTTKRDELI